jgi:hypothetical protein
MTIAILSAIGVMPNTLHKSLKPLNLKEDISNNIQRGEIFRSLGRCHVVQNFFGLQE